MKKVLLYCFLYISLIFFALLLVGCKNFNFLHADDILKINISDTINDFDITEKSEMRYFISFFKNVKPFNGNPSCPFQYLQFTIYHKNNKKYILNYASDLCPNFKYKDKPYCIDDASNHNLRRYLRKNNIQDHMW